MTSLLHDIGNPPFGHFAEETINKWMKNNIKSLFDKLNITTTENNELKETC